LVRVLLCLSDWSRLSKGNKGYASGNMAPILKSFHFGATERSSGFVGFFLQASKSSRKISDGEKVVNCDRRLRVEQRTASFRRDRRRPRIFRNPVDPFSVDASLKSVVVLPFLR